MREFSGPREMGIVSGFAGFALLAGIGLMCYLLSKRLGPFQPGSFLSSQLGLDQPYTASTTATTTSSTSTGTGTTTAGGAATATTTAANATTPLYSTVNGLDMVGSDVPPDASKPAVFSQPTYAATGCQAICSSDSRCKAAVYQPSTQLCWMKSGVTTSALAPNADRVFMPQGAPATGQDHTSTSYTGPDAVVVSLPTSGDCSALCASLPFATCQASVYGPDTTCRIKNSASGPVLDQKYTSWMHGWSSTATAK